MMLINFARIMFPGDQQAAYLADEPVNDARFIAAFAHSLVHTGGYTQQEATRVAMTLLPDIFYYDPRRAAAFPENGRTLTDDVMDVLLPMLTNGKVTGDGVGAHKDLLTGFPYLGSPHLDRTTQLVAA